jgi:hypothetical protein
MNDISVLNTVNRFANSFDLKSWDALGDVLADEIVCDYRDLRGVIETLSRADYVKKRIVALDHLKTQHLFTNHEIQTMGKKADCRLNAFIIRQDTGAVFHTHAVYDFKLIQQDARWLITHIKQTILWNEGDSKIHAGVASERE